MYISIMIKIQAVHHGWTAREKFGFHPYPNARNDLFETLSQITPETIKEWDNFVLKGVDLYDHTKVLL